VGPNTARGGEILARALESAGATLVGETTLGWAPLAEVFPLDNGGLLRINTAFFLDGGGKPIKEQGLEPRVKIEPVKDETPEATLDRALAAEIAPPDEKPTGKTPAGAKGHGP
jgi:carboxyl-terminal processing protease